MKSNYLIRVDIDTSIDIIYIHVNTKNNYVITN